MTKFALLVVPFGICATLITPANAQTKPRTYQATQIHANCIRTYSDVRNCTRTLEVVRGRYGNTVTMVQWNSAAGIVRHMNRQGK
ncbi:MAG: hypothetical protein ABL904_08015 [Hyphomicrobiaceae bacterium]